MKNECFLCKKELETTFLDKIKGTVVKTGSGETAESVLICSSCQKEHRSNLKEKLK